MKKATERVKRYRLKLGGCFVTDGDFNHMKFTTSQAKARAKEYKRRIESRFTNGFTFQNFELIKRDDYYVLSLA